MQSLHRVEKSPPLMVRAALRWEISRLRVSWERFPSAPIPTRSPARDDDVGEQHWTHLRCEGSQGSQGCGGGFAAGCVEGLCSLRSGGDSGSAAEGGGLPLRAMGFIIPPAAVTSTSSIIIILTLVHPFATPWPSSPKGDARTLRDWLSVSYVTQYPVPPIFSFPLEGKCLEEAKGVQGRAPI